MAASLVGEKGFVTGVDMTDNQLDVARGSTWTSIASKRSGIKKTT